MAKKRLFFIPEKISPKNEEFREKVPERQLDSHFSHIDNELLSDRINKEEESFSDYSDEAREEDQEDRLLDMDTGKLIPISGDYFRSEKWEDEPDDISVSVSRVSVPSFEEASRDMRELENAERLGCLGDKKFEEVKRRLMMFLVDGLLWEDYE